MLRRYRLSKIVAFALMAISLAVCVSPCFAAGMLKPKDSSLPDIDIKDHVVKVVIENGYAITQIDQVFFNPSDKDMEAIYSFPVPENAVVSNFTMWINSVPIVGEVLEKEEAKKVYEDQKANNKTTGLTSKNSYKTFEVNIYPVLAGKETKVHLEYMQVLPVDTGIGRYVYPLEEGGVDEEGLQFWTTNTKVSRAFSFDLIVRSNYPIANIRLPAHPAAQIKQKDGDWYVHMDNGNKTAVGASTTNETLTINNYNKETAQGKAPEDPGNSATDTRLERDIVVYYKLAENLPGSVDLVAYKRPGSERGTFMMTVTPGIDLKPITEGRDWAFVLDASGSMQSKYATLAQGVSRALDKMNPNDRFRIIAFNERAWEITGGYTSATKENVNHYIGELNNIKPDQCTNLYAGLDLGLRGADADRTTGMILVTDGVANFGVTKEKEFIDLVKKYDIRLFTFIMGNSSNMPLLKSMTDASDGTATTVSNDDDIIGKIMLAQSKVGYEALHGVEFKISDVKTGDITPGKVRSLYRGEQLVIMGHYFGSGTAQVELKAKISGEDKVYRTTFNFPNADENNPEIERLWAYASCDDLQKQIGYFGETKDSKQAIVDLGVEYSLVTDYTSMVIVEEEVFKQLGIDRKNLKRTDIEQKARSNRAAYSVSNTRVDTNAPMFSGSRSSTSGGAGAMDPVSAVILSPILYGFLPRKTRERIKNVFKK